MSRERQALIFETLLDAVLVTDPHGLIVDWNPAAERMFGYTREEVLGQSPRLFHDPDRAAGLEEEVIRALRAEGRWAGEIPFRRKDGTDGVSEAVVVAQRDASGAIVAHIGVNRDVTERRRLEEQLAQAQKMEAVGRLAGGVAHDFNNLLTGIKGYTSFLLAELPDTDPRHDDVREIEKAADRAAQLTRQLLALSRRQELQPRVLDLNGIVADLEKLLRRMVGEHIVMETRLASGLHPVEADPGKVEQVVMNLVVNARDAMPDGGRVVVETSNLELDAAEAPAHGLRPGGYALLVVSDTGCGIEASALPHIFEPFFTTKCAGRGTGLGLSTVYGIVKQSGGDVWVTSRPGHGAAFHVCLPRVEMRG